MNSAIKSLIKSRHIVLIVALLVLAGCGSNADKSTGTVSNDQSQLVSFVSPLNASTVITGSVFQVDVQANDANGQIQKIELYLDGTLIGEKYSAPYQWGSHEYSQLAELTVGGHQLRADVTDNSGRTQGILVSFVAVDNQPPNVLFSVPAENALVNQSTPVKITVQASDSDGQIQRVGLYLDGALLSEKTIAPYEWSSADHNALSSLLPGSHQFKAEATDNLGTKSAQTLSIRVNERDNDGQARSTNQFSAPSSALFSLNNDKQRVFPSHINTGFSGNGHAETWDGRVFVRTKSAGWFVSAFRPQRITLNTDGTPNFKNGAFGDSLALELDADVPDMQHNWISIVPDPAVSGENPYPSDANGAYLAAGTFRTYKALVIHTSRRNGDNDQMGQRRATFVVGDGNSPDAQVVSARFTTDFAKFTVPNGDDFRCIEPSTTIDGRLIFCQGYPDNNGSVDSLVYSWNATPGNTNWSSPKSIANLYYDERDKMVAGIPFATRYPIAERPLKDAAGAVYAAGTLIKGAYPWISHDGSELFYQATRINADNTGARRTGTTVVGRWTGWTFRHIDGPLNRDRHTTSKLFLSSPGAFTTMWIPYKNVADLKIPYSVTGPSYPIFGSNTSDYSEVAFDDYLDGNYVMQLSMNEQLNRDGTYIKTSTPDTSGNFNNATLVNAKFPLEFNNNDALVGRFGQAIHFESGNYLNVTRNQGWESLRDGFTIDFFIRKSSGGGTVRLFTMNNGIEIFLVDGATITGVVIDTNGARRQLSGPVISNDQWSHVALSYNAFNKAMALYVDGERVANSTLTGFAALQTSGAIQIGPINSTASMILDEVKVSNIARSPHEIAHNAYARSHRSADSNLQAMVPSYLSALVRQAAQVHRFSAAAVSLGGALFNDVILSKQRTTSCATCHQSNLAFTDGNAISRGNEPTDSGVRNTPSLLNRLFSSLQGWSGQAASLDSQALIPIQASHEMNLPIAEATERLSSDTTYLDRFQAVYGELPTAENISAALASFQATQFSPKNRVDEYLEGNLSALSGSEQRGLHLFEGKARCSGCHSGQNYTDESFRNNGLATGTDIGRAEMTGRDRDFRLFKVPSLRELRSTGPFLHDGSKTSLAEVLAAYNSGGQADPMRDTDIRPLELTNQELLDLEAFLNALSAR